MYKVPLHSLLISEMGCGSSVAALPEHAITYDNGLPPRDTKNVRSSESYDSGVGYELGSKESTSVDDEALPGLLMRSILGA